MCKNSKIPFSLSLLDYLPIQVILLFFYRSWVPEVNFFVTNLRFTVFKRNIIMSPNFFLCRSFLKTYSSYRVLCDSPKNLYIMCIFKIFTHQGITWNFFIIRGDDLYLQLLAFGFKQTKHNSQIIVILIILNKKGELRLA